LPKVTYIGADGSKYPVEIDEGQSLMEGAIFNDVPGIIGLCGGICSCATCHCYVEPEWAAKLPSPSEGELSMLDRATDRRSTSRLGCQIIVTEELDGLVISVPSRQSTGDL